MNRKIALLVLLLTAIALAGVPEASAWERDKPAFEANSRVLPSTRYQRNRWCLPNDVRRRRGLRTHVHPQIHGRTYPRKRSEGAPTQGGTQWLTK